MQHAAVQVTRTPAAKQSTAVFDAPTLSEPVDCTDEEPSEDIARPEQLVTPLTIDKHHERIQHHVTSRPASIASILWSEVSMPNTPEPTNRVKFNVKE